MVGVGGRGVGVVVAVAVAVAVVVVVVGSTGGGCPGFQQRNLLENAARRTCDFQLAPFLPGHLAVARVETIPVFVVVSSGRCSLVTHSALAHTAADGCATCCKTQQTLHISLGMCISSQIMSALLFGIFMLA